MVLVTGATGFLGRHLCPQLVERGFRVRALVRPTSDTGFLQDLGVQLALGDVRDLDTVRRAMLDCEWIVHAAGLFRFWGPREAFFETNVHGTDNVIEAALQVGVQRYVHISTLAVVGAPTTGQVLDEQIQCQPQDDYQRSKLQAEQRVLAAHRESGLPAIVLRPGAFYGPWGRYAFNRLFFEDPLKGLPVGVHWGRRITFPAYVPDVARAIVAALGRGRVGEIYNVVGECLPHSEVHGTVSRLAGIRPWRVNPPVFTLILLAKAWSVVARYTGREPYYSINMVPYVFCDWDCSHSKARRELGFEPTPFEDGARHTLAWYRQQGLGPGNWLGRAVASAWQLPRGASLAQSNVDQEVN
jgi:dihydroflavonol-4-reductase